MGLVPRLSLFQRQAFFCLTNLAVELVPLLVGLEGREYENGEGVQVVTLFFSTKQPQTRYTRRWLGRVRVWCKGAGVV